MDGATPGGPGRVEARAGWVRPGWERRGVRHSPPQQARRPPLPAAHLTAQAVESGEHLGIVGGHEGADVDVVPQHDAVAWVFEGPAGDGHDLVGQQGVLVAHGEVHQLGQAVRQRAGQVGIPVQHGRHHHPRGRRGRRRHLQQLCQGDGLHLRETLGQAKLREELLQRHVALEAALLAAQLKGIPACVEGVVCVDARQRVRQGQGTICGGCCCS